jgi:hypothetical protein
MFNASLDIDATWDWRESDRMKSSFSLRPTIMAATARPALTAELKSTIAFGVSSLFLKETPRFDGSNRLVASLLIASQGHRSSMTFLSTNVFSPSTSVAQTQTFGLTGTFGSTIEIMRSIWFTPTVIEGTKALLRSESLNLTLQFNETKITGNAPSISFAATLAFDASSHSIGVGRPLIPERDPRKRNKENT